MNLIFGSNKKKKFVEGFFFLFLSFTFDTTGFLYIFGEEDDLIVEWGK